jgi:hypothetical protein
VGASGYKSCMSVADLAQLKEDIRQSFRKACLKRLQGEEAAAVVILQNELPDKVRQWQSSADASAEELESLFADELARTENAYWIADQVQSRLSGVLTKEQAEAMQAVLTAQLQMGLSTIKERLQTTLGELITYQGAEALGGRVSQELAERITKVVGQTLAGYEKRLEQLPSIAAIDGLLARLPTKADTDKVFSVVIDGVRQEFAQGVASQAKGVEMLATLQQKLEAHLGAVLTEVKVILNERLGRLVTAETFEGRLMSGVAMLHDAQHKAIQEATVVIQAALEKRLAETSAPIYQRVSSLLTFNDWERISREANEKLSAQLSAQLEGALDQMAEAMGKRQGELEGMVADRTEAAILRIQDMRTQLDAVLAAQQSGASDGLKQASERIASLLIQSAEDQKGALRSFQKDLISQQTQSLGMLSVQQQNFLGGLQRDWDLLNKNMTELKSRQATLEGDLRAIAVVVDSLRQEQVKTRESVASALAIIAEQLKNLDEGNRQSKTVLPQALQSFERQLDTRLRDHAQFTAAEINALQRKLEAGISEAFSKRLRSLRVVAD